jgi:hypothetical protein
MASQSPNTQTPHGNPAPPYVDLPGGGGIVATPPFIAKSDGTRNVPAPHGPQPPEPRDPSPRAAFGRFAEPRVYGKAPGGSYPPHGSRAPSAPAQAASGVGGFLRRLVSG